MYGTVLLSKQQKSLPGWKSTQAQQRHQRMDPRTCLLPAEQGDNEDCRAPGSTEAGGETPSDPSILSCEWGQWGSLPAASSL